MSLDLKQDILNAVTESERLDREKEKLDRRMALRVLQDLSSKMYPDINLFGQKTLVIRREDFEKIRAKYLDRKG